MEKIYQTNHTGSSTGNPRFVYWDFGLVSRRTSCSRFLYEKKTWKPGSPRERNEKAANGGGNSPSWGRGFVSRRRGSIQFHGGSCRGKAGSAASERRRDGSGVRPLPEFHVEHIDHFSGGCEHARSSSNWCPVFVAVSFWGEGSPTKIDYRKKSDTLILTSDLVVVNYN